MMTNNKENLLMDRDKQYTPLEREVSPKDAFTKAAIFTKFERDKIKKIRSKHNNKSFQ